MTWEGLHIKWKFYLFFFLAPQISRVQKKLIKLYKNLNAHTHTHNAHKYFYFYIRF